MNQAEAIEAAKEYPWARFVAEDDNGFWHAFSESPCFENGHWNLPRKGGFGPVIGSAAYLGKQRGRTDSAIEVPR